MTPSRTRGCPTCCGYRWGSGGLAFKAGGTWPRTNAVYCHPIEDLPGDVEVLERVPVRSCVRRGAAINLVLDRGREHRSQFVFTTARRREDRYAAVFKQDRVRPAVVADALAELQVTWPAIPIVFADTRPLAEEWTYRFPGRRRRGARRR